jgi:hypothetical protein
MLKNGCNFVENIQKNIQTIRIVLVKFFARLDVKKKTEILIHPTDVRHVVVEAMSLTRIFRRRRCWPNGFRGIHASFCGRGGRGVGKAALDQRSIYVFPEMKLRGLVPNSYIHVSVSDLYIPGIGHRYMNVEIGRQNIIIRFWKYRGCKVSFLVINKSEPYIYIGFSPVLHLQCVSLGGEKYVDP